MKLGLVQTKHTDMYNFLSDAFPYSKEECIEMQQQQIKQNFSLLQQAQGKGIDLLVTTECINFIRTGIEKNRDDINLYPTLEDSFIKELSNSAKAANSWLVAGAVYRQNKKAYNAAFVFNREGELVHVYHKMHLAGDEGKIFTPGETFCTIETDFGKIGVCICWDLQIPEVARTLALDGAQLIVCPTWGWEAELYGRARAYENGVAVAACMAVPAWGDIETPRTPSSIAFPDGSMSTLASHETQELFTCEIELAQYAPLKAMRMQTRRPQHYNLLCSAIKEIKQ